VFPSFPAKPSRHQVESRGPIISAITAPQRSIVTAKKNISDTSSNPFGAFVEKLQLEIEQCLSHLESNVCHCGSGLLGSRPPAGKATNSKFQKGKEKA
jgi:hypothetical protein